MGENNENKLTAAHILDGLNKGGIESLSLNLINHSPNYLNSRLINIDKSKKDQLQAYEDLILKGKLDSISHANDNNNISLMIYIINNLCRNKPDFLIIYPCNIKIIWVAIGAKIVGIRKIVVHIGNTAPIEKANRLKWKILFLLLNLLNVKAIPCSKAILESIKDIAPKKFLKNVVYNGCDSLEISHRANIARKNRPINDKKRIIMVARFDKIKDHKTLIKAFSISRIDGWQLCLVGTGNLISRMRSLAYLEGIKNDCIFLEDRSDIAELLGQSDIFAFSTTSSEGFGIALIEAIASGIAVIASDVPACREVLKEGSIGELIPQGNILAWSEKLSDLMINQEKINLLKSKTTNHTYTYDIKETSASWYKVLFSLTAKLDIN